ncbi:hypothetical protein GCM10010422_00940 [Streptomyces graminearus]|uniref:Uncharacterized protein n=1 Tax=Streptomyces graminearus TaxID=284030 RepID=A0ABN3KKP6_9ACTN
MTTDRKRSLFAHGPLERFPEALPGFFPFRRPGTGIPIPIGGGLGADWGRIGGTEGRTVAVVGASPPSGDPASVA